MTKRTCFREPWDDAVYASKLLSEAVSEHLAGNVDKAAKLFTEANIESIRDWWESIAGSGSPYVKVWWPSFPDPNSEISPDRMPNSETIRKVHERDGYYCRFCWMPVIRKEIRKRIAKAYPNEVPFWRTNNSRHCAFFAMWAQYDHILPHSRWGNSHLENIVLTCSACNFWRMEHTLDEVWLEDPRNRPPIKGNWNWLENFK